MDSRKRKGPPGGGGPSSESVATGNGDNPEHSPDHHPPQGLIPVGRVAAEIVAGLKFRRRVERLHALGPRVLAELLAEIGAERSIQTIVDLKLDRYAGLNPEAIEAAGGDAFWPLPIHKVQP